MASARKLAPGLSGKLGMPPTAVICDGSCGQLLKATLKGGAAEVPSEAT